MANSNSPPPRRGVCPRRGDTMRTLFCFFFSVLVFIADRHVQGKKWEPMDGPRAVAA